MSTRPILLFFFLVFLAAGCHHEANNKEGKRPLDHWVFRSVLDGQTRMVTLALSDDLWAAYFAETGALYKAWKGTVYFDGAVYTTAHGPQPITIGNSYIENKYKEPWFVLKGKDTVQTRFQYKGHRIQQGKVSLMYALEAADFQQSILIYEEIETDKTEAGQPVFRRKFTTSGVPEGTNVCLKTNVSSVVDTSNVDTDGQFIKASIAEDKRDSRTMLDIDGVLVLHSNGDTRFDLTLITNPVIPNKNAPVDDETEEEGADTNEGLQLIARSDCRTCHNKNRQTIGPSYTAIAGKYENTKENLALLSQKVKKGGSGVWGTQAMTPHADLPDEDIEKMVGYILSLDAGSEKTQEASAAQSLMSLSPTEGLKDENMLPGSVVRIFRIPANAQKIPVIDKMQKPLFAGILPKFDNISGGDFKQLEDNFSLTGTGYLHIKKPGTYSFHIWSDDGSKLYLNDQLVIDNDGPHGVEYGEVSIQLKEGYYAFRLEYFQGGGGKFLSFNWKKPGDKDFEVIPEFHLFHTTDDQQLLRDFRLPMADVSKIPGDQYPLQDVHPSFDLTQARPGWFKPKVGGMDFLSDGRLVVSTWDSSGSVFVLENVQTGDTSAMTARRIAFGLAEPLGLKVVNDTIYVMQKHEMTRLIDTDKDGTIDEYQTLCDDWKVSANFHEFGFGLAYKDGYLYATLATAINPGGASTQPQIPDRGKVIKVNRQTGEMTFVASGLRTPNGIGIGYKDDLFVADNQGDWLPSSKIVHVREGAWFGSRSVDPEGTKGKKEDLPVVWLPQDEIGNSPSTPLAINVGVYKGQMIHGEVTHGGVKRVFVEEVNGQLQGCVFRFTQGLEAGVNRMVWGPDGALYIGGIGNPGNWGHTGKLRYGLQRLAYNGKPAFEMLAVRAKSNGMEIEFTEPLRDGDGWNPAHFEVKQWYYKPTQEYGGPKLSEIVLPVKTATVSEDRKRVFLEFDGQKANHMIYIRLKKRFVSEEGRALWSTEAWYTMNEVPVNATGKVVPPSISFGNNTLSPAEAKAGWKLLFDGKSLKGWRNFKKNTIGKGWIIDDEAIHLNAKPSADGHWQAEDGGDIISDGKYGDFEFLYDWKIGNCGNSGVMFHVVEDKKYKYVWETGPEMQVLDNSCHPDTKFETHRAADLYDMIACRHQTVKPAGEWNEARIVCRKGQVSFWLNGLEVVQFPIHDSSWKERIAKSKFKDMPDFGKATSGHLSLQDHGDKVWYRNLKIREL